MRRKAVRAKTPKDIRKAMAFYEVQLTHVEFRSSGPHGDHRDGS